MRKCWAMLGLAGAVQVLALFHSAGALAQGALASGQTSTGAIAVIGQADAWTFAATTGDSIVVRVGEITQSGNFTPRVRLYDPGAVLKATASGATAAEVTVTAASAGTFTAIVDDAAGTTATGTYRVTLARSGTAATVAAGDEGGALVNGALHTGTIGVGDLDVWTVTANPGDALVVRMGETVAGSALSPWLRLYSPTGTLLDTGSGSAAAEVTATAPSSGTYVVVAADGSSGLGGSGGYRLTLAKTAAAVTVSPGDEGGALVNGAVQTGTIDVGDMDVWTVSANPGDALVVRMGETVAGSALSPWVRIYSPTGTLLGTSFGSSAAEVVATAASAGTYLVVAADASNGLVGSGTYRLTLAKTGAAVTVSSDDEGGPLVNGALHIGTIDVGDLDVYTVTASPGDALVVRMGETVAGSALSPWVRLYSPSGTLVDSSFGSSAAEVVATAASAGTYVVVAADGSSGLVGSGTYRLTLAKTGAAVIVSPGDEGGPLVNGALHTGTIDVGDLDVYTLSANPGDAIVVRMGETIAGSALSPWVRIYSPTGTLLGSSFGSSAAEVVATAASAGTYVVVAADGSSGLVGSGTYRITLATTGAAVTVSAGDSGGPLVNGAVQAGTIDVGELDVWTVTANSGDAIVVRMGETIAASPLSPWVRIYSPAGTLLDSSFGSTAAEVGVTAASSGTYTVVAADGSSGLVGSGGYRLSLARTGAPVTVSVGDEGGPLPTGVTTAAIDVGDLDAWTIGAKAGDLITVTMAEVTASSPLTPWLRLYSPSGTALASVSGAATAHVSVTANVAGTFLLVAGDGSSGLVGSGAYTLTKGAGPSANANLANLALSAGTLSPSFASGTTSYGAIVVSNNDTLTVTPTLADATATVSVNGAVVASGTASRPITLVPGGNSIGVVVLAQDGVTTRSYVVNVTYVTGSSCTYALSPLDRSNVAGAGGVVDIVVTTPVNCPVAAISHQPWVAIQGVAHNGGTTTVTLAVAANPGASRATSIVVADRLFLVTQSAP